MAAAGVDPHDLCGPVVQVIQHRYTQTRVPHDSRGTGYELRQLSMMFKLV